MHGVRCSCVHVLIRRSVLAAFWRGVAAAFWRDSNILARSYDHTMRTIIRSYDAAFWRDSNMPRPRHALRPRPRRAGPNPRRRRRPALSLRHLCPVPDRAVCPRGGGSGRGRAVVPCGGFSRCAPRPPGPGPPAAQIRPLAPAAPRRSGAVRRSSRASPPRRAGSGR